jgi:hypothetical protein
MPCTHALDASKHLLLSEPSQCFNRIILIELFIDDLPDLQRRGCEIPERQTVNCFLHRSGDIPRFGGHNSISAARMRLKVHVLHRGSHKVTLPRHPVERYTLHL